MTSFLFATDVDLCMTCALPAVDSSEATAQGSFAVGSRVRRAGNDECGKIRQIQGSTAVVAFADASHNATVRLADLRWAVDEARAAMGEFERVLGLPSFGAC